jgi:hypothetical protein
VECEACAQSVAIVVCTTSGLPLTNPLLRKNVQSEVRVSDLLSSTVSHELFRTQFGHETGSESGSGHVHPTKINC